jgi:drug/metabolite transporter (DMT)-like permease
LTQAQSNRLWLGTLTLLLGASCIALAPIMVKLSPLGPQASAFWRLCIAVPALAMWAMLEARQTRHDIQGVRLSIKDIGLIALTGFLFAGDLATWHAGIVRTSAANATFLSNLTPIVVVAVGWMMTRALPARSYWIAVIVALFGSLLLSGGAPGQDPNKLMGDGLSALTSLWYGLYLLVVARLRTRFGAGLIMLGSSSLAAVLCLIVAILSGESLLPHAPNGAWWMVWWPLIILGLISHVGGQGLLAVGFGLVPTHIASLLILWQPVLAAILGWVILSEALSSVQLLGAAMVLLGVWLAKRADGS